MILSKSPIKVDGAVYLLDSTICERCDQIVPDGFICERCRETCYKCSSILLDKTTSLVEKDGEEKELYSLDWVCDICLGQNHFSPSLETIDQRFDVRHITEDPIQVKHENREHFESLERIEIPVDREELDEEL